MPLTQTRKRWLELLDLSYATRRVTYQQIERGIHAVVVPPAYREEKRKEILEADIRSAIRKIPEMAHKVQLTLTKINDFNLPLEGDYRQWMGNYGQDIASGATRAEVFIDLAFLEAALLHCLWEWEVIVDFHSPICFFRRGALSDYANVLEAVAIAIFEGRSLPDTARLLSVAVLAHLQLYADSFVKLSKLYPGCIWRIERDAFVMEIPRIAVSLKFQYWELRGGARSAEQSIEAWYDRIESLLLQGISNVGPRLPKSFAA